MIDTVRSRIVPVILSGGSGTRLWPLSRVMSPKQLRPLVSDQPMITDTIDRVSALAGATEPIIVAAADLEGPLVRATRDAARPPRLLILEPFGRNTAPAVAMAALAVQEDDLLLVLPADHVIAAMDRFVDEVAAATSLAAEGHLVTFGITPTMPETGYGYIRAGDPIDDHAFAIAEFKEKPDLATATAYVESGEYSWNSGMFLLRAGTYLEELGEHQPDIAEASRQTWAASNTGASTIHLDPDAFRQCRAMSIDHAVMEHTERGAVIPADLGWNDVGSWQSLWDIAPKDDNGNVIIGDVVTTDTEHSYIRGGSRLIAVAGLRSVVVVDTPDAVFVGPLASSQDVRHVVEQLDASARPEAVTDATTVHAWGVTTTVAHGEGYHIDEATIDAWSTTEPQQSGSSLVVLQVVSGSATVTVDGTERTVEAGASFQVPLGRMHTIRNASGDPLRVRSFAVDTHTTDT